MRTQAQEVQKQEGPSSLVLDVLEALDEEIPTPDGGFQLWDPSRRIPRASNMKQKDEALHRPLFEKEEKERATAKTPLGYYPVKWSIHFDGVHFIKGIPNLLSSLSQNSDILHVFPLKVL